MESSPKRTRDKQTQICTTYIEGLGVF